MKAVNIAKHYGLRMTMSKSQKYLIEWQKNRDDGWPQWREAKSINDLGSLVAKWLRCEKSVIPGHVGPPDPETEHIVEDLIHLNEHGFITVNSQPQLFMQKSWVSGIATYETSRIIADRAREARLLVLREPLEREFRRRSLWQSITGATVIEPPYREHLISREVTLREELETALKHAVALDIQDPGINKRHLWDTVRGALEEIQP